MRPASRAFSLVELIIVLVIVGVLGALAIPRASRAGQRADAVSMRQNAAILNRALDWYAAEHDRTYPTASDVNAQMTGYTDVTGTRTADAPDPDAGIIYGPYLASPPLLSIGPNQGRAFIADEPGPDVGWLYVEARHLVLPNLLDADGRIPLAVMEKLDLPLEEQEDIEDIAR